MYEGDFIEDSGYEGFTALYKKNPSITALVCANDEMATGAMVSAREHGIELPAQLSIIGYDNMFFTRHVYPPLSTINYPIDEMGKVAAQWVLSHVYQKSVQPIQTLFQPELVIRQSVVNIT